MHITPGSDDNQVLIGVISYSEDEKSVKAFFECLMLLFP